MRYFTAGAIDEFRPHGDQPVRAIRFVGDSSQLATASKDGVVKLNDVESCKTSTTFASKLAGPATRILAVEDSTMVVGDEVRLWSERDCLLQHTMQDAHHTCLYRPNSMYFVV